MKNFRQRYSRNKKQATAGYHTIKITTRFMAVVLQDEIKKHVPSTELPVEILETILHDLRMLLYYWLKKRLTL